MKKQLKSGVIVDAAEYYELLEWKDTNSLLFKVFLRDNHLDNNPTNYSINNLNLDFYNKLLAFSGIKK